MRTYSFTKSWLYHRSFLVKLVRFYRTQFLKKTAGQLLLISGNILDGLLVLSAINQLTFYDFQKQLLARNSQCFLWKYLKIIRTEARSSRKPFCWWSRRNKESEWHLAEAVMFRKKKVILNIRHTHRKTTLLQFYSLRCKSTTLVKRILLNMRFL